MRIGITKSIVSSQSLATTTGFENAFAGINLNAEVEPSLWPCSSEQGLEGFGAQNCPASHEPGHAELRNPDQCSTRPCTARQIASPVAGDASGTCPPAGPNAAIASRIASRTEKA